MYKIYEVVTSLIYSKAVFLACKIIIERQTYGLSATNKPLRPTQWKTDGSKYGVSSKFVIICSLLKEPERKSFKSGPFVILNFFLLILEDKCDPFPFLLWPVLIALQILAFNNRHEYPDNNVDPFFSVPSLV